MTNPLEVIAVLAVVCTAFFVLFVGAYIWHTTEPRRLALREENARIKHLEVALERVTQLHGIVQRKLMRHEWDSKRTIHALELKISRTIKIIGEYPEDVADDFCEVILALRD